ncbi:MULTISPECIES: hypothetical protein [Burkholderia]|nr:MULTISPECIES: hypothetical protein [Burkholderia]
MNDANLPRGVKRMLWNLNVNVAHDVHPLWRERSDRAPGTPCVSRAETFSMRLIEQHRLGFVSTALWDDELGRIALLDAIDLRRLARLGSAVAMRESIRLCVLGNDVRHCTRVLGRGLVDRVLALPCSVDAVPLGRLNGTGMTQRLPLRLLRFQRRILRALCDCLPDSAARRVRLKFRPGYFKHAEPVDDARKCAKVVLAMHEHADLSARAKCILGY